MPRPTVRLVLCASAALLCSLSAARAADAPAKYEPDFTPQTPLPALSPEEELKTIHLAPGYSLELVLSERDGVKEPVAISFDGNGRMYLAELRTYMQEIDGKDENAPVCVVSRHESTKGDGKFDKHSIYRDKMVLPRMILPLDDRVLINETDTNDIFAYRDTNGDGVADEKTMWYPGGPRGGNLEHQQSGLIWGLDNWIYQTTNAYRLRWNGTQPPLKENTPSGGGQWGLNQDNYGKLWWSNAGGEKGLWHFQTPIIYGAYDLPGMYPEGFQEVWPLIGFGDFQGGPSRVRPSDKTVNHFTASCGQEVVRVDRLPQDIRGDVLISEPVGRLIRRAKVTMQEGVTTLTNPYEKSEFIRSSDGNFRVVNIANGPDGCLYLVDMYRGIIQEGNWVREGSYLRKVVEQYHMDKVVGHARIWRLVHKDFKPGPQPHMLGETPAQLVAHLEHPNGWWRDTAQKLLVVKGDKSVVPALTEMARGNKNQLARIHALWTLEGLGAADPALVRALLKDADPQIRTQSIRVAETLVQKGDASLVADIQAHSIDTDAGVQLQVLMTGKLLDQAKLWPNYSKFAQMTLLTSPFKGVKNLGTVLFTGTDTVGGQNFTGAQNATLQKGQAIFREVCFACHGFDGKGMPMEGAKPGMTMAPPLAGSDTVRRHPDAIVRVLLSGLTGPVGGKTYDAQMVPMNTNDDEWIAAVGSYVRNSFGNRGTFVTAADVARLRVEAKTRTQPWTADALRASLPGSLPHREQWKLTASVNPENLKNVFDNDSKSRWDTKASQIPGMWFQIELPQETALGVLRLDQGASGNDYPRGYRLEASSDGQQWKTLSQGKGTPGVTEIPLPGIKAKFLKITTTASQPGTYWSISELEIFEPTAKAPGTSAKL